MTLFSNNHDKRPENRLTHFLILILITDKSNVTWRFFHDAGFNPASFIKPQQRFSSGGGPTLKL